jgi:putative ABC transport system permease protein
MLPDWKQLVRAHLAPLHLTPERELEVVEELALHLEAAYETALAKGLSAEAARAQALAQISDWRLLECELSRAEQPLTLRLQRQANWQSEHQTKRGMRLESLWQDLRYGARMLKQQPSFSLIAVITLALGIGANSTIFSFFNGVLLRPLPFQQPERLVLLDETAPRRGLDSLGVSYSNFLDWRAQNQVFSDIGGYHNITFTLTGVGDAEELPGAMASHDLFKLLGVAPLLGRTFTPEEDQQGRRKVVILSYGLWQRRFGGDPQLVGRTITLVNRAWGVVGVMPPDFKFPTGAEFWIPLTLDPRGWPRTMHGMGAIARLKPGVTLAQAQSEMNSIARRLEEQYPATNEGLGVKVFNLRDQWVKDYQRGLWVLLGVVGFVLLIACANVANLLLARAATRQKELAIRAALGASRFRLVRQMLCESLLLGALGGVVGMWIAWRGLHLLLAAIPIKLPFWMKFNVDGRVLLFTLGVSLLTSLVFGAAPALQAARVNLNDALKEGGRSGAAGSRQRLRQLLVVAEVALALILLVGAGLMMRSFLRLQQVNLGLNPDNALTLRVTTPGAGYGGGTAPFFHELLERVNALPGVEVAGATVPLPLEGGGWQKSLTIEGRPVLSLGQAPSVQNCIITQHYFRALGIPLLAGRTFNDADAKDAPRVVIIDETLAREHWPNENPLGQRIRLGPPEEDGPWQIIVGVVGAVRHKRLDEVTPGRWVYQPILQVPVGHMSLVVRSTAPPESLIASVRAVVKEMDANLPITHVMTMREFVAQAVWQPRLYAILFAVFATVALLLAAVGIYGVMSYAVTARTNEIGIRMALGAERRHVLKLVIGQGLLLALSGVAFGLLGAWLLTRLLKTLLFGVSVTDPLTFVGVALLLLLVAWLACFIPARRATQVDPLVALRCE